MGLKYLDEYPSEFTFYPPKDLSMSQKQQNLSNSLRPTKKLCKYLFLNSINNLFSF